MTPFLLRRFWFTVENTQASVLLKLDDAALVQCLMRQLGPQTLDDRNQVDALQHYIASRISLIRDLAQQRLGDYQVS
ncbi:hypothetical protein [Trichothermofontia sp.]